MAEDLLAPPDGVVIAHPRGQGAPPGTRAVRPSNLLYVSGWLDPDRESHTDVKSQTVGALESLQTFLESKALTLADAVLMHAYIGSESGRDGYAAGYADFFGPHQPHKPAHSLLHVVRPAGDPGALVEIDLIALCPSVPDHA